MALQMSHSDGARDETTGVCRHSVGKSRDRDSTNVYCSRPGRTHSCSSGMLMQHARNDHASKGRQNAALSRQLSTDEVCIRSFSQINALHISEDPSRPSAHAPSIGDVQNIAAMTSFWLWIRWCQFPPNDGDQSRMLRFCLRNAAGSNCGSRKHIMIAMF